MTRLYQRRVSVVVDTLDVSGFDCGFEITRTLDATQNTCELAIYNLSEDKRKELSTKDQGVVCEIRTGYSNDTTLPVLFRGRLRYLSHKKMAADWVTVVESGDGDKARTAKISASYAPGVGMKQVVVDMVRQMKGEAGNLIASLRGVPDKALPGPMMVQGNGDNALGASLDALGLEHSWQDDALQVLQKGGHLAQSVISLDSSSGLIGSAEYTGKRIVQDQTQQPTCRFVSLLRADLRPGVLVSVDSQGYSGSVVIRKVSHRGETFSSGWYSECEGLCL